MDKRMFKKNNEELQQFLMFQRRGSKVAPKKGKGSYNRKKLKKSQEIQEKTLDK